MEDIGKVDVQRVRIQELDRRDGEGQLAGDQARAEEVQLEDGDEENDGLDSREDFPRRLRPLRDTRFLVDRGDALADGYGAAVDGLGDIRRSRGEGNAARQGEGASRCLDERGGGGGGLR